ncbi:amino acid transport protein [Nannochloropsis oceanica]
MPDQRHYQQQSQHDGDGIGNATANERSSLLLREVSSTESQYSSLGGPATPICSPMTPAFERRGRPGSRKRPRKLQGRAALNINLLTALNGPASFAIPWAFQEAGLAAGVIGVVLVALFSYFTLWFLIRCKRHLSASGSGDAGAARGLKQQEESGDDGGADKGKHPAMAVLAPTPLPPSQQQQQQLRRWRGLQDNDGLQQLTYAEIAALSLGAPASSLVKAATCISCLGACAAYATFIAGMLTQLFPVWEEGEVLCGLLPIFVLLSWVRGFRRLSFFNVGGNLSLVVGVLAIFYDGFTRLAASSSASSPPSSPVIPPPSSSSPSFLEARGIHLLQPQTLFLFFGPTAFLFVIHYCAVPIESEAEYPEDFTQALGLSMALTAMLDIAVGSAGYIFYGGTSPLVRNPAGQVVAGCERPVCDNVLKNIEAGPLKTIIFAAFSLNLTLTYIIMLAPPREYLEEIVVGSDSLLPTKWQRNILRSLLVTFTFVVASTIHQFGLITAFVGAITDTLQGFILPPLIYAATFAACVSKCEKMLLWAMSGLGVVLMFTATSQNVGELKRLVLDNINQKF